MDFKHISLFCKEIKVAHSIFALPFVATGILLSKPLYIQSINLLKVLICMVSARTFAMGMNRVIDWRIDKMNQRTKQRKIATGELPPLKGFLFSFFAGFVFILTAFTLSIKIGLLSMPLLGILAFYSYTKRFTFLSHAYLGLCLGLSPIAASLVLNDHVNTSVIWLGVAVMFWTTGFDILYATQDEIFDRDKKLFSIPAKFGIKKAVLLSRLSFILMIISLLTSGVLSQTGIMYYVGTFVVACILFYEQWLVKDLVTQGKSDNLNVAFFNMNAWVSVIFYLFAQMDVMLST